MMFCKGPGGRLWGHGLSTVTRKPEDYLYDLKSLITRIKIECISKPESLPM